MGLLPAASRTKRLVWALVGGYGLFLHAALVHREHLWAENTSTSGASSSSSSGGGSGAITSLVSRALLRKHSPGPPQAGAAAPRPQYEAQALSLEEVAAAAAAAKRQRRKEEEEPPITSPASAFWQAEETLLRRQPGYAAAVSANSSRPVRTPGEMGRAQECFRRGEGYAYLVHMRKAGGTTMRQYLNDFVVERETATGARPRVYVTEGTTFNVSCFRDQGELMVITSLRHPIARILSAYWFEGRYLTNPPPLHPNTDEVIKGALYDRQELEARLPLSFREWVRRTRVDDYTRWHQMSKRTVWNCVDNYYVRTLTQRYRPNPVAAITEREFQLAKRVLASFDLVMITEHLKWENQTAYARGMLFGAAAGPDGGEEAGAGLAEARRRGLGAAKGAAGARLQHHNKAQGATERDESAVDAETLRAVWRQNRWDVMLYDYARGLRDARMAAFLEKGELPRSDGKACKAPVNDPGFLRDGVPAGADPDRPLRDSVLFTAPECENNDYAVLELDESLDFAW